MRKYIGVLLVFCLTAMAGCVDPEAVLTVDEVNDTQGLADSASRDISDSSTPVVDAVRNGTSTEYTQNIDTNNPELIEYNGSFYEITKERTGTTESQFVSLNITTTSQEAQYSISDLSEKDAEPIIDYSEDKKDNIDQERIRYGQRYTLDEVNKSVILEEEQLVVSYQSTKYEVQVTETDTRTEDLFVYSSQLTFDSAEEYSQHIEQTYVFELSTIPSNGTDVWNEAVESGGYYGEHTEEYESIRQRFVKENAFEREDRRGTWYTRYDGNLYRVELDWISDDYS